MKRFDQVAADRADHRKISQCQNKRCFLMLNIIRIIVKQ